MDHPRGARQAPRGPIGLLLRTLDALGVTLGVDDDATPNRRPLRAGTPTPDIDAIVRRSRKRRTAPPRHEGAVELDGFNLHASVAIAGDDDLGRERLMRYGARAPLALDRLRRLPDGRIAYRIKKLREGR